MHWDIFDRFEWKDFDADREKMLIMSALISRLEGAFGAARGFGRGRAGGRPKWIAENSVIGFEHIVCS